MYTDIGAQFNLFTHMPPH